jgi:hypothetical protein
MTFTTPVPLEDALRILREKKLVPTALGSDGLRELAAEVKNAALFSARMTQLRPLQVLAAVLAEMIQGQANVADAKLVLTEVYRALGYDPEQGGFPQDPPGTIPPALRGTLRDLSSERRMELTITTNYRMVTNAAFVKRTTEDEQRRYQFPCFELVRIAPRTTPRGFVRRNGQLDTKPGDDWESRWVAAGGELYEKNTRMIALKGAAVWAALGAGEGGYTDTLGNPFPPFAFGSGMGLREVSRGEALTIGVIAPEDQAAAMPSTLRASLKAQGKGIPKDILDAFDDLEDDGEWLRLAKARQLKAEAARKLRNDVATLAEVLMNARTKNPRAAALLGWITRRLNLPPKMMSVAQADFLLEVGVAVKSKHGDSIRFGQSLKAKLDKMGAEGERRKTHLAWALHTVMSGAESGRQQNGEWRRNYARIYKPHGKKEKAMLVVTRVKDGEAFDIMRKDVTWVKAQGLDNRSMSGRPLTPTSSPYAAASKREGALNCVTLRSRCKLLAGLLSTAP